MVKLFDDAAVKAGVVVSVSSGDAGTASTIGSPATDPNLISVGASTQFQAYAQANLSGARYFASKGWLSDNISAISSSGYSESGGTVDLVAPGDSSWDSCTANTAKYADCTNFLGRPERHRAAGGTSESAPFVSGAAALVFQAFRSAHHGANPTPAQVKRILLSTATDLGTPAQDQGAGLLNSYRAVQLARSYGAGQADRGDDREFGRAAHQPDPAGRHQELEGHADQRGRDGAGGDGQRPDARPGQHLLRQRQRHAEQLVQQPVHRPLRRRPDNYATFKFRVPAGQGRLNVAIAYDAEQETVSSAPTVTLFDPQGRIAANSLPQGVSNFGNTDVRAPAAGLWTAVVSSPTSGGNGGFAGKVTWQATTQKYRSFGSVSPSSLTLGPGKSGSFVLSVKAPAAPGDLAGSVLLHASAGGLTTIPVVVRSLINPSGERHVHRHAHRRQRARRALGTSDFYQFDVPAGTPALQAEFALAEQPRRGQPGQRLPGGTGRRGAGLRAELHDHQRAARQDQPDARPRAWSPRRRAGGRWSWRSPRPPRAWPCPPRSPGRSRFAAAATLVPQTPLPQGTELTPGKPLTIPVTITNTSNAPQDYYLDPRLSMASTVKLTPFVFGKAAPFAAGLDQDAAADAVRHDHVDVLRAERRLVDRAAADLQRAGDDRPGNRWATATRRSGRAACPRGRRAARRSASRYAPAGGALASGIWVPAPTECGPYQSAGAVRRRHRRAVGDDGRVRQRRRRADRRLRAARDQPGGRQLGGGQGRRAAAGQVGHGQRHVQRCRRARRPASGTGTLYLDTLQGGSRPIGQVSRRPGDRAALLLRRPGRVRRGRRVSDVARRLSAGEPPTATTATGGSPFPE